MKISHISLIAALVLVPSLAEASATPGLNYNARSTTFDRPTTRSIEASKRANLLRAATQRRAYMRSLRNIEQKKDEVMEEDYQAVPSPAYRTQTPKDSPYHWFIRRRSVRHQYWDWYYNRGTDAHTGQGLLGDDDYTSPNHRTETPDEESEMMEETEEETEEVMEETEQ